MQCHSSILEFVFTPWKICVFTSAEAVLQSQIADLPQKDVFLFHRMITKDYGSICLSSFFFLKNFLSKRIDTILTMLRQKHDISIHNKHLQSFIFSFIYKKQFYPWAPDLVNLIKAQIIISLKTVGSLTRSASGYIPLNNVFGAHHLKIATGFNVSTFKAYQSDYSIPKL